MGKTYLADRLSADGAEIESCLDHVYASENILHKLRTFKLDNSATDHLPIVATFMKNQPKRKNNGKKSPIFKRSMKMSPKPDG